MTIKKISVETIFDFFLVLFIVSRLTFRTIPDLAFLNTYSRYIFFAVAIFKTFISKKIPSSHYFYWIMAFGLLSFFVSIVVEYSSSSFDMLELLINVFIDIVAVVLYCFPEKKIDLVFKALFITGIVIFVLQTTRFSVDEVLNYESGNFTMLRVSISDSEHCNITGYNLFISLLATYYLFKFKKLNKIVLLIGLFCVYFGIILSGSRKILITAMIVTVFMFIGGKKKVLKIVLIGLGCLLVWYLVMNNEVLYRIVGWRLNGSLEEDESFTGRMDLIITAFDTGLKSIIGVGLNNSKYYTNQLLYAHNNLLEIFADLGFLGVIIFYSMHIAYLIQSFTRLKGEEKRYWVIMILALLVVDMGQVSYNLFSTLLMIASLSIGLQHKVFGARVNNMLKVVGVS